MPRPTVVKRTVQTMRLSHLAQSSVETTTAAQDEDAAHGGGASFFAVEFKEFVDLLGAADGLADFEGDELADEAISEKHRKEESGERCAAGSEGVVLEDVQNLVEQSVLRREQLAILVEPVDHAEISEMGEDFLHGRGAAAFDEHEVAWARISRRCAAQAAWSGKCWRPWYGSCALAASLMTGGIGVRRR
jgi:hypothetical protein